MAQPPSAALGADPIDYADPLICYADFFLRFADEVAPDEKKLEKRARWRPEDKVQAWRVAVEVQIPCALYARAGLKH
jgi:hypothetical protein